MPVLLTSLLLFGTGLALTPSAAAHDCEDDVPGDCGDCSGGEHQHAMTGGLVYRCSSGPSGCPTPISPLMEYLDMECGEETAVTS